MAQRYEYAPAFPRPIRLEDPDYLRFIRRQPCIICGAAPEAHHTITRKAGGADYRTLPLCRNHHREVHQYGRSRFEQKYRLAFDQELVHFLEIYLSALKDGEDLGAKQ